ncbi:MAG: quinone-dependent dihydroorotate dehydrogenase [Verrucomicrobiales bacterium]
MTRLLDLAYRIARPALFCLDAEAAHDATLGGLRFAHRFGLDAALRYRGYCRPVRCMGLEFPNRLGLAAGLDKAARCVDGFGEMGFGHVEVGTLTPQPQPGNPQPRLFRLPAARAIINRMGFNNPGIETGIANLRGREFRGILGINVGKNFFTPNDRAIDDYLIGLRAAYAAADYIAVNLSSPNTKGLRDLQNEKECRDLCRRLKAEQRLLADRTGKYTPIAIKIAPDLTAEHVASLANVFAEEQIDGVIATNTTIARDAVAGLPHGSETGGLSGAPVRDAATAVIKTLAETLQGRLPIIGVGGILCGADAVEKLEAGADLVQVYSGLIYRGPALVHEVLDATATWRRA